MHKHKSLVEIHEDVPADHYDRGIKRNLFQRSWHNNRFRQLLELVDKVNGPILDVGCHSGNFTKKILTKAGSKKVYGVDISPGAVALAKKRIPYGKFQVADASKLPYKDNFFDAVFCLEMLEHVDSPLKVIKEIRRVLKKNGRGLVLVPTDNPLFKIIWSLWTLYYPVWRHAHVQSFQKQDLENMLEKSGFKILKVKTFNLNMLKIIQFEK